MPRSQRPLLFTMNCLNGYFHFPFFNSLAEELVQPRDEGVNACTGAVQRSHLRRFADLSKGESRQVALLCVVAHRPELLILDEPGGVIDAGMRREFLEMAIALLAQEGSTIVFSPHHVSDVERLADNIWLMRGESLSKAR